jgi:magnesium chelatase accessory protein
MTFFPAKARLSWDDEGRDWPNREASQFITAGGLRWHVQRMGRGPQMLLVHGTGAATHSWRALAPILAKTFDIVAPDLPGHGFTDAMPTGTLSLPGMARALAALLKKLEFKPSIIIGHSAGAAILVRLCLDQAITPKLIVSLNGAMVPFGGMANQIFPSMAKLLFLNPFVPRFFAWTADRIAVSQLLRGTGSSIDREGTELYARLISNPDHVAGALGMMANWDLETLFDDLPKLNVPLLLISADGDRAVTPEAAEKIKAQVPGATIELMRGLGHLAHEEQPEMMAELILRYAHKFQADGVA